VRQIAAALELPDPSAHARRFIAARAGEVPRRSAVAEVLPPEPHPDADADRDLPMPKDTPHFAVSVAFARALSRAAGVRPAPRERPSAETLLAGFDYEPEI
jgi:hypothetical protein